MGRKRTPGLYKRNGIWVIDKKICGQRLCESTGTNSLEQAEHFLTRRIEQVREAKLFGVRQPRSFAEAATRYLLEHQHKASICDDAHHLKILHPFIGHLRLQQVHNGSLAPFIEARKKQGMKNKTINLGLAVVRLILNLASVEWLDENGNTWLESATRIKLLPLTDSREPYPLSIAEQNHLFSYLPEHLRNMALFKVNTGCRDTEVCSLQWEWEIEVPQYQTSVFIIPGYLVKNREDRLVVVNHTARSVIDSLRGKHSTHVFTYNGKPVTKMNNSAWKRARKLAELEQVRVHDLKHTFGRRLRAAGVSFEDRQDLLGHRSSRITTHYSSAELHNLINAANKVCSLSSQALSLLVLRKNNIKRINEQSAVEKNECARLQSRTLIDEIDLEPHAPSQICSAGSVSRKSPAKVLQ